MSNVRISTLGGLGISSDEHQVDWLSSQRMRSACLVFIAVEREVSRDRLLGLFWPDSDLERARRSLSQVIYTIRRTLGDDTVLTDGDRIRIGSNVDVDIDTFARAAESGNYELAAQTYRGRFLADTTLAASAEFEQWLDAKRAVLERTHRRVRRQLIDQLTAAGAHARALETAVQWCELDADDDEAHHRYIQLLIQLGRRVEAIRHFELYCERLKASDLEPLDETVELIASLRAKQPDSVPPPAFRSSPDAQLPANSVVAPAADPEHGVAALIAQLKKRRVIGPVVVYLVLAWGAIEVSNTVFPLLALPEWGPTLIVVLALLGLPFTIFFAWQYDITASGVQRTDARSTAGVQMPRVVPRWATVIVVAAVLLFAGWSAYNRFRPRPMLGSVAVFPFCVSGEGMENEADDIALMLANEVDKIPELQSADPNALISVAAAAKLNCRDAAGASEVARKQGASRFILGSLTRAGNEIRATATLYDLDGKMKWAATASAPSNAWLQVIDSLVGDIVEKHGASKGDRMLSVATTARSHEALKAYLDGERHLRALQWGKASESYQKAVEIDSTYALAWLRLAESLFSGGAPMKQRRMALQQAKRYAVQMPEREQRLLHALDPVVNGVAAEAINRLRSYLGVYPDDPQAWYWLGDAEMNWGAMLGHDFADVVEAHRRGAELGNRDALFMLAWDYVNLADFARSDSVARLVLQVGAGGDWVIGIEAAHAFHSHDRPRIDAMLARIDGLPDWQRSNGPLWAVWAYEFDLAEQIAERALTRTQSQEAQAVSFTTLLEIRISRGKRAAVAQMLERYAALDPAAALRYLIKLALEASPADPAELRDLRQAMESLVSQGGAAPGAQQNPYALPVRLYWLGRLSTALGELDAAERFAARVQAVPPTEDAPTGNTNLAAAIRAHIAAAKGDTAAALGWLDRIVVIKPFAAQIPDVHNYRPERKLRAEILARAGRHAEAARWYMWFGVDDMHALKRLGELYENTGDRANAVQMYGRLRDLLAECDPEYRPLRQYAEQRLKALRS